MQENTGTIAFFVRLFLLFDLCIKCRVLLVADSNSIYFAAQIFLMFRCNIIAGFCVVSEIYAKIKRQG